MVLTLVPGIPPQDCSWSIWHQGVVGGPSNPAAGWIWEVLGSLSPSARFFWELSTNVLKVCQHCRLPLMPLVSQVRAVRGRVGGIDDDCREASL